MIDERFILRSLKEAGVQLNASTVIDKLMLKSARSPEDVENVVKSRIASEISRALMFSDRSLIERHDDPFTMQAIYTGVVFTFTPKELTEFARKLTEQINREINKHDSGNNMGVSGVQGLPEHPKNREEHSTPRLGIREDEPDSIRSDV